MWMREDSGDPELVPSDFRCPITRTLKLLNYGETLTVTVIDAVVLSMNGMYSNQN